MICKLAKNRFRKLFVALLLISALAPAHADYVGEVQTTKYLDPQTVNMISQRLQNGQPGIQVGDEVSYFIHFTPVNQGGMVGAGGYVTDYIPAGTQVVGAQFVQIDANGGFTQVAPPSPAAVLPAYVPIYSETGIFYSTDPRAAKYTSDGSEVITQTNGYPAGIDKLMGQTTTHNFWDSQMYTAYAAAARIKTAASALTCATPTWAATLGASPVAGADAWLQNDYTGSVGPWKRISYPGSYLGTPSGTFDGNGCVGGVPTAAGWNLSPSNPLPANTTAVRFVGGKVTVGQLFAVRISLKVTQPVGAAGLINATEVFGGDASLDPGSKAGKDNPWKYHFPSVANADSSLTVIKRVTGMCVGAGCIPQPFSGGAVPAMANLKLRYEITYMNTSGSFQNGVTLTDCLPTGAALVAGSEMVVSGANILPTAAVGVGVCPAGSTGFQFQPLGVLGSGSGGNVRFDVNFAAAPAPNAPLMNTAKLTSVSIPGGVQSVATVTPTNAANLVATVATGTPSVAPGGTASYTLSLNNYGGGPASTVVVNDYLPSAGGTTVAERFSYQPPVVGTLCGATPLAAGQACGSLVDATGVATPIVLTVTNAVAVAPSSYAGQNREQLTFTPPAGTVIPSGGRLDIAFNATVGANVPATTTGYGDDVVATYGGGFAVAPAVSTAEAKGVAPVKVEIPLQLGMSIECVYSGAVCVPYSGSFIPSNSKIKYRLDYVNTGGTAQANVVLADTLPTGTTLVPGSEASGGAATITPGTLLGQTLTFATIPSLAAGASGWASFDVQLGAAILSGSYITNSATLKSAAYSGGASASLTTSVLDSANLAITKTTATPTIAPNGSATYTLTVTNTGNTPASNIIVYDELPYTGTLPDPLLRFNYNADASVTGMTAPVITAVAPPTLASHMSHANQQEVKFNFGAQTLAPGASFSITYTAAAGAGLKAGSAVYLSDAVAQYNSGLNVLYASQMGTAAVTMPSSLQVSTTIDCIYDLAGTACEAYTGSGLIPPNAKVRYKVAYQNTGAAALNNVYLCQQSTSTQTVPVFSATYSAPVIAPTPAGPFADTPPIGTPTTIAAGSPAATACGYSGANSYAYPAIASLAAGASGTVYYDLTTNAASGAVVTHDATLATANERVQDGVSSYVRDLPVLQITKATSTPAVAPGSTASYQITVKNTGTSATSSLKVYDFLPFSGSTLDAAKRFAWLANGAISCSNPASPCPTLPVPTTQVAPTESPYSSNPNQQQVLWDFGAVALAPGQSLTFGFDAQVGASLPVGNYDNGVRAVFGSPNGAGSGDAPPSDTSDRVQVASAFADIEVSISNGVNGVLPGSSQTYTIVVKNNGPQAADGLLLRNPAASGLSKTSVSCSSDSFSCPLFPTLANLEGNGLALNPLPVGATVTVTVQADVTALNGSVTSTAIAVLPSGMADPVPATPTTVADTDSVLVSDLSALSSKSWVDGNGGSHDPGDPVVFTITLVESGGIAASNVQVTDALPTGLSGLTVLSIPGGATDNSTTSTLYIQNISVPANGSVQIKFQSTIAAGTATGTSIVNQATVNNPGGYGDTLIAPSMQVGTPPATGMKALYLSNADAATGLAACSSVNAIPSVTPCKLSRTVTPNVAPDNALLSVTRGDWADWQLTPVLQSAMTLDPALLPPPVPPATQATIPVTLNISTSRAGLKLQLDLICTTGAVDTIVATMPATIPAATLPWITPTQTQTYGLPLAASATCPAGSFWKLRLTHVGKVKNTRWITVTPVSLTLPAAKVELPSQNVINVDSVVAYSAAYPATTTVTNYAAGDTVYLRAVVSDPFGSFDITSATVDITDSANAGRVTGGVMTVVADSGAATKTFEYAYTIPAGAPGGIWDANVTAKEGTENTVSHSRAGGFSVLPPVDHYEILVGGSSIACLPTTVNVVACQDASNPCTAVSTGINGTVSLATSHGALSPAIVTLTNGVGTAQLTWPDAVDNTTVDVSVTAASEAANNGWACSGGTGCTTVFNTAGFIVSDAAGNPATSILTQTAGVDGNYVLRAVKTNSATKACEAGLTGPRTVEVAYECKDPASCYAADLMSVNGGLAARNNSGAVGNYSGLSFTFDANGNAPFTLNHLDVGDVALHFRATGVNQAQVGGAGATLLGSSNTFRVLPHHLAVMACTGAGPCTAANAAATDGTGPVFAKAGDPFAVSVEARAANEAVLPSFGTADAANAALETVSLTHTLVAPSGGNAGELKLPDTNSLPRSSFVDGVATVADVTWSEVGVMQLTATASQFMGGAWARSDSSGNVGRFVPHHFDTVATGPMNCAPDAGCVAPVTTMAYSGQPFSSVEVSARNAADVITGNYRGVFAHAVDLTSVAGASGTLVAAQIPASAFTGSASSSATFTFASAPTAPADVAVRAVENAGDSVTSAVPGHEQAVRIVSGRIKVGNAYGSDKVPLMVPVMIQYFDGSKWELSTTDGSTVLGGLSAPGATVVNPGSLGGGVLQGFKLSGSGKVTVGFGSPAYLTSVSGQATFGIYKGRNELIYRREAY